MIERDICESDLIIFANKFKKKFGVDISGYKKRFLTSKIETFMERFGYTSLGEGMRKMGDEQAEEFKGLLSIPTTEFFRDDSMFEMLQNRIFQEIKEHKQKTNSKILRIWSAGCSTGEETYSLAMVLHEVFGEQLGDFIFSITGTDINPNSLLQAKKGEYHPKKTEKIPLPIFNKHFHDQEDKHLVRDHLRYNVRFQKHDLLQSAFATHFDLILFRNVGIYLSPEAQGKILKNLCDSLNQNGFLVIGKTETMPQELTSRFEMFDLGERVYRKL